MPGSSVSACHLCHLHSHNHDSLVRTSPLRHSRGVPKTSAKYSTQHRHHRHSNSHSNSDYSISREESSASRVLRSSSASALARLSDNSHSLPGSRSNSLSRYNREVSVAPDGDTTYGRGRAVTYSASTRSLDLNPPIASLLDTRRQSLPRVSPVLHTQPQIHPQPDILVNAMPRSRRNSRSASLPRNTVSLGQDNSHDYYLDIHRQRFKDEKRKHRFNLQTVMLIGCYTLLVMIAIVVGVVLCYQNGWLGLGPPHSKISGENTSKNNSVSVRDSFDLKNRRKLNTNVDNVSSNIKTGLKNIDSERVNVHPLLNNDKRQKNRAGSFPTNFHHPTTLHEDNPDILNQRNEPRTIPTQNKNAKTFLQTLPEDSRDPRTQEDATQRSNDRGSQNGVSNPVFAVQNSGSDVGVALNIPQHPRLRQNNDRLPSQDPTSISSGNIPNHPRQNDGRVLHQAPTPISSHAVPRNPGKSDGRFLPQTPALISSVNVPNQPRKNDGRLLPQAPTLTSSGSVPNHPRQNDGRFLHQAPSPISSGNIPHNSAQNEGRVLPQLPITILSGNVPSQGRQNDGKVLSHAAIPVSSGSVPNHPRSNDGRVLSQAPIPFSAGNIPSHGRQNDGIILPQSPTPNVPNERIQNDGRALPQVPTPISSANVPTHRIENDGRVLFQAKIPVSQGHILTDTSSNIPNNRENFQSNVGINDQSGRNIQHNNNQNNFNLQSNTDAPVLPVATGTNVQFPLDNGAILPVNHGGLNSDFPINNGNAQINNPGNQGTISRVPLNQGNPNFPFNQGNTHDDVPSNFQPGVPLNLNSNTNIESGFRNSPSSDRNLNNAKTPSILRGSVDSNTIAKTLLQSNFVPAQEAGILLPPADLKLGNQNNNKNNNNRQFLGNSGVSSIDNVLLAGDKNSLSTQELLDLLAIRRMRDLLNSRGNAGGILELLRRVEPSEGTHLETPGNERIPPIEQLKGGSDVRENDNRGSGKTIKGKMMANPNDFQIHELIQALNGQTTTEKSTTKKGIVSSVESKKSRIPETENHAEITQPKIHETEKPVVSIQPRIPDTVNPVESIQPRIPETVNPVESIQPRIPETVNPVESIQPRIHETVKPVESIQPRIPETVNPVESIQPIIPETVISKIPETESRMPIDHARAEPRNFNTQPSSSVKSAKAEPQNFTDPTSSSFKNLIRHTVNGAIIRLLNNKPTNSKDGIPSSGLRFNVSGVSVFPLRSEELNLLLQSDPDSKQTNTGQDSSDRVRSLQILQKLLELSNQRQTVQRHVTSEFQSTQSAGNVPPSHPLGLPNSKEVSHSGSVSRKVAPFPNSKSADNINGSNSSVLLNKTETGKGLPSTNTRVVQNVTTSVNRGSTASFEEVNARIRVTSRGRPTTVTREASKQPDPSFAVMVKTDTGPPEFPHPFNTKEKENKRTGSAGPSVPLRERVEVQPGRRRNRGENSSLIRAWAHMDSKGTLSKGRVHSDGSFAFTNCRPVDVCKEEGQQNKNTNTKTRRSARRRNSNGQN